MEMCQKSWGTSRSQAWVGQQHSKSTPEEETEMKAQWAMQCSKWKHNVRSMAHSLMHEIQAEYLWADLNTNEPFAWTGAEK